MHRGMATVVALVGVLAALGLVAWGMAVLARSTEALAGVSLVGFGVLAGVGTWLAWALGHGADQRGP